MFDIMILQRIGKKRYLFLCKCQKNKINLQKKSY